MKAAYYIIVGVVVTMLLSSCGSSNKFASSFGKRKYTKGYYVDVAGKMQKPVALPQSTQSNDRQRKVILSGPPTTSTVKTNLIHRNENALAQSKHCYIGVIAKTAKPKPFVVASPIVNAVSGDGGGRHNSESGGGDTHYSFTAGMLFLFAFLAILVALILGASSGIPSQGFIVALTLGVIAYVTLDFVAIVFAVKAINHHEPHPIGAFIVLIINGISLLGMLGL